MAEVAPLLEFRGVHVARGERPVLHGIDLKIGQGERVAILGPNGCGKSTLIKTINRELYPLLRAGTTLRLMGQDRWNVWDLRQHLGIVSNDLGAACARDITARQLVLAGFWSAISMDQFQATPAQVRKADEMLALVNATYLADRWMDELSSGEARRVLIARALVHDPDTLLLDEPGTSLDLASQHELRETMRRLAQRGTGLLLVTHHLSDLIPEIDRIIFLQSGRIAADGTRRELLTEAMLSGLFGLPVRLWQSNGYCHAWS